MTNVTSPPNGTRPSHRPEHAMLTDLLDDWVGHDLITPAQADRIRTHNAVAARTVVTIPAPVRQSSSLAVEALGYLGGVIVVVSSMLITAQYWDDLGTPARLAIVGFAALALVGAGAAVPRRLGDVGVRLRSVLWLAGTVAAAGFLGLFGHEVLDLYDTDLAMMVSGATALVAAGLWAAHRVLLQQAALMVSLMVFAGVTIANLVTTDALPGLGVWGVAVVWLLLGWGGILGPREPVLALGSVAMVIGGMITVGQDWGIVLSIATAATLVAVAVLFRDLFLLAIGAFAALQVLPVAVSTWFPDSRAVPYALLLLGLALVGAALWTARRRRSGAAVSRIEHDLSTGTPTAAAVGAGVVATAVTVTVLVVAIV